MQDPATLRKEGWTTERVVRRYCEVRFLFDHCPRFVAIMDELKQEKEDDLNDLRANWHDSDAHEMYHDTWDDMDFVATAEKRVLREGAIQFPENGNWPWMHKASL